jgi:hypothetical protein
VVDLPTQDESGDVTAQAPQNRVSGRQYAMAGSYLAQGLEKLSTGLNEVAVPLAQQQAAQDLNNTTVTKDAQGNTVVRSPMSLPILGPGGVAYDSAIAAGTLAKGDNQVSQDLTQLRVANPTAAGFKTASDSYRSNLVANNPGPLGQTMADAAARMATQHYNGMVIDEANQHVNDSKAEINNSMTANFNALAAMAQGGQAWEKSPEYQNYMAASKSLTSNPAFGVDPKIQAANDAQMHDQLTAFSIAGEVDRNWNGPGGPAAARQKAFDAINDPSLNLSPAQRKQYEGVVDSRIQFNVGQNEAAAAANRADVAALRQAALDPSHMSSLAEPNFQAAIAKSQSLGDTATVQSLINTQLVWRNQMLTRGVAPNQSAINQGVATPSGPTPSVSGAPVSTPQGLAAYKGRVAQIESSNGQTSSNIYQFQPGTIEKTGWTPDRADQEAAMDSLTASNRSALAAGLGREPTQAELYLAHQQGAQGAMQLMAQPSRRAGDVVGDKAINGNGGNSNMTAGDFVAMWQAKFNKTPLPANGVPFTQQQLNDHPGLLSTWAASTAGDKEARFKYGESLGTAMEQSINNGFAPPVNSAATFLQIAQDEPRLAPQAQKLVVGMQGMAMADQAVNLPPGQGTLYMEHVQDVARNSPDLMHQQLAIAMEHALNQKTEALKKDPFGTAVAEGWDGGKGMPGPLNFNDPTDLAVGLHQRSDLMGSIAARTGDMNMGALAPNEVDQVKSQLDGPNAMTVASALSTLPPARMNATLAQLGEKGAAGQTLAIAGSLYKDAPDVAQDITQGALILRGEKGADYAPKSVDANAEMDKYIPNATFGVAPREALMNAVTAVYAKMSADAKDTSGSLNSGRFEQAVDRVTGGVLNFHGGQLIAPQRGMAQGDFDGLVSGIGDTDLRGAVTLGGQPITGSVFQNSAKLENAGDGKYFVRLGSSDTKPIYAYSTAPNGGMTKFVLDLKNRTAPAAQQQTMPVDFGTP